MTKAKHLTQEQVAKIQGFRSGLEDTISKQLEKEGINPKYETLKLPYRVEKNRSYTPDFPITEHLIIETKGRFQTADRMKMLDVQRQYPNIEFRFVFTNSKQRISKKSVTTYAQWCERNGFKYADKIIPQEWIDEIKQILQKEGIKNV